MTKIKLANATYTYMHDDIEELCKKVDSHHIVVRRRNAWVLLVYTFGLLLSAKALYLCSVFRKNSLILPSEVVGRSTTHIPAWADEVDGMSRLSVHVKFAWFHGHVYFVCCLEPLQILSRYAHQLQGIAGTVILGSMLFGARLVYSLYQTCVVKESVVIMPAFGVQLETHFWSGRVVRSFIPVDKILKPVLNEHLTPITCYWSLALIVRGKEELVLAFKEVHLPVKMLAPIWKALCAATGGGESADTVLSDYQIWMHADHAHTGFLAHQEFYNALKLVSVAQIKQELTPDIVKAALDGRAEAKILAPQINLPATPTLQINLMAAASAPKIGVIAATASQNLGFGGPGVPNAIINQNYFPSQKSSMRLPQAMPAGTGPRPQQGIAGPDFSRGGGMVGQTQAMPAGTAGPGATSPNISSDWLSGRTVAGAAPTGFRGLSPSKASAASKPQTLVSLSSQQTANGYKALVVSGNGFSTDSVFGCVVFSATSFTNLSMPLSQA